MSQIRCLQEGGMLREDGKRKCKVRGLKPGSGSGSSKDMIDIDNIKKIDDQFMIHRTKILEHI